MTPQTIHAKVQIDRHQRGFSLIEVLVTMLILAFGLLGVAGLLVKGVSNSSSSEAMAKASQLAGDLADRMRANSKDAVSAGSNYVINEGRATNNPSLWIDAVPTAAEAAASVGKKDVKDWAASLATQLPEGRGRVEVDDTNRKVLIEVAWSNCLGTLSDADTTQCKNNSAAAFKKIQFEVRL